MNHDEAHELVKTLIPPVVGYPLAALPFDLAVAQDMALYYTDVEVWEETVGGLREWQVRWFEGPKPPRWRKISKSDQP